MSLDTKRIDIRIPMKLLEKVEQYQEEKAIATRTGAFLELVRIGLDHSNHTNT